MCIHAITPTHVVVAFASSATRRIEPALVADLLVHDGHRDLRLRVEAGGDLTCMRLDVPPRRLSVHLLAPGDEPDLELP